ncbi:hypothetical protein BLS_001421 [Venturia inaequalis]|uniref:Cell wall protein n=1 Tax=Venturia inaequalis TaxID=5025 RepID=A0A8H3VR37_VENIN|nr:hypothetical protein BLS_001421 [Venturia inaequalis]KAE9987610.1 hypothetical protein EG328_002251 [Venturia inaequalis]KAE9993455.1 hypothetical protein EG327_004939 [Venturia inaequalis]RDI89053.1 hypothetical protein Vi05172_g1359 [Venturia inaequalis]
MHFTIPILACLAGMSLASPTAIPNDLATRDTIIVDRSLAKAQAALTTLTKSIDAYFWSPQRNAATQQRLITEDAQVVIDALTQGAQQISTGPTVDRLQKPTVVVKAKELLDQLRKTNDSWVRAKSLIVGNGGRQAIGDAVRKQANAANSFATALVSKMPGGEGEPIAFWYEKEVKQAVQKSVAAFN